MNHHLTNITPEQRRQMLEQAKISRQAKKDASGNIKLMADDKNWRQIASDFGVRLPPSVAQSDEHKYVKRIARKLGVDINSWIREVCGATSLKQISDVNPNIGAVGLCGLFLEWVNEEKSK